MPQRYICIHGHFYQPPRENPWLEAIELQDSAYPYHDWNERITVESYAPNARSRILDDRGRIARIVNNYSRISFNFGPTLLAWMQEKDPETYSAIVEADQLSRERFGGHGSALAQAYNHMIIPLANERDKRTQVRWGLHDFQHRFGRAPEGMWLPETAADVASLEMLAEHGVPFTILAPNQAGRIRRIGEEKWIDVGGAKVDPTRAYRQTLPSGRSIVLFFYDGPISRGVAFEGLLKDGRRFADRLLGAFDDRRDWPQLAHIATDGETYGHHHRHGEMALAFALEHIDRHPQAQLINYGQYLEKHPPEWEAEIVENTSWSCAHGVDRWRGDCGCSSGLKPGWNQAWREPLRNALDWLRDELAPRYEAEASALLKDPWAARDAYIAMILDRSPEHLDRWFGEHAARELSRDERVRALKLLELQRHALLMYTSCGWFFDELSGIETVQVVQYAGRAIQLGQDLFGNGCEQEFLRRLEAAPSNVPELANGRQVYERMVRPAMVDLVKVGAHHAISTIFEEEDSTSRVYCYDVAVSDDDTRDAGRARLSVGRMDVTSIITGESARLCYGAVHLGDHNVNAGVRPCEDGELEQTRGELLETFERADFPAALRVVDRRFGDSTFTLRSLFRDQQRMVLERILKTTLEEAEAAYRQLYRRYSPLMRFLGDLELPMPNALEMAAEYVLNTSLIRALSAPDLDLDRVRELLDEARARDVALDAEGLGYALEGALDAVAAELLARPQELELLERLEDGVALAAEAPLEVNLWELQNAFYQLVRQHLPGERERAAGGDERAEAWLERVERLGDALRVAVR